MFTRYNGCSYDYPYDIRVNGKLYARTYTMNSVHATINAVKKDRPNDHIVFEVEGEIDPTFHIYGVIYKEVHNG
jgi:hypothetical protein